MSKTSETGTDNQGIGNKLAKEGFILWTKRLKVSDLQSKLIADWKRQLVTEFL